MRERLSIAAVNAKLSERIADLARELLGSEPTDRRRDEWRFRRKGSLAVLISGPKRGAWHDHEAGCGGDPLGLVAHLLCVSMRDAFRWALAWLGEPPGNHIGPANGYRLVAPSTVLREAFEPDPKSLWSARMARALWVGAVPAKATLAEAYLRSRGLNLPDDAPLRFHPAAWRNADYGPSGPAMVAQMSAPETGEPCGTHVTYLSADGCGKADGARPKVMLGAVGVIRLVPDEEVTLGLGLGEGIETALAVMQRTGWAPVWAATSAGAIKRFPVLPGIEALTIFADADGPGMAAARESCRRWAEAGCEARIVAPPAGDWDDALPRQRAA